MFKAKLCLGLAIFSLAAHAQWISYPISGTPRTKDGKANLTAPAPKTSDGKPDLSGLWTISADRPKNSSFGTDVRDYIVPPNEPPLLLREASALFQKHFDSLGAGRPSESCLPHGIPDMMLIARPFKIVQNSGLTLILYEFATRYRQVLTDGRPHPVDMNPAWFGYSIGK
jgi:hypothetical protein